jgi:hypothetical protein
MCCEPRWGLYSPMERFQSSGCCCTPHGHHHLSPKEEKEWLESYRRDIEDELSRVEARIKKIKE